MYLPGCLRRFGFRASLAAPLLSVMLWSLQTQAFESVSVSRPLAAQGTLEPAFAPWDDVEGKIVEVLQQAQRQILLQAYILTSKPIVEALLAAHQRGIEVRVLVDASQLGKSGHERLQQLHNAGIEVRAESKYKNAHDNCNPLHFVTSIIPIADLEFGVCNTISLLHT